MKNSAKMGLINMNNKNNNLYLNRPWVKWLSLVIGLIHIWTLTENVQEYLVSSTSGIFSPEEWERYAAAKEFSCVISAMLVTLFIGNFLVGTFAKSKWGATKAYCAILVLMAAELGLPLLILRPAMVEMGIFWVVFFVITLILTVYNVYQFFCEKKKMQAKEGLRQTE